MKKLLLSIAVIFAFAVSSQAQTWTQSNNGTGTSLSQTGKTITSPFNWSLYASASGTPTKAKASARIGGNYCFTEVGNTNVTCSKSGYWNISSGPVQIDLMAYAQPGYSAYARVVVTY